MTPGNPSKVLVCRLRVRSLLREEVAELLYLGVGDSHVGGFEKGWKGFVDVGNTPIVEIEFRVEVDKVPITKPHENVILPEGSMLAGDERKRDALADGHAENHCPHPPALSRSLHQRQQGGEHALDEPALPIVLLDPRIDLFDVVHTILLPCLNGLSASGIAPANYDKRPRTLYKYGNDSST
ncbi:MAG: hypothetical protein LiPW15_712 [Parcubacteria group bacterium LiPW_15]|nr:MAG: hypothetical protein LiPW15_712 [Parcubacteria group bacterium LiPW_15]